MEAKAAADEHRQRRSAAEQVPIAADRAAVGDAATPTTTRLQNTAKFASLIQASAAETRCRDRADAARAKIARALPARPKTSDPDREMPHRRSTQLHAATV